MLLFVMLWVWSSAGGAAVPTTEVDTALADPTTSEAAAPPPPSSSTTTTAPETTTTTTTTSTTTTTTSTSTTSTTTTVPVDPGTIFIAEGSSGSAPGPGVRTYRVEVEAATGFDPAEVAEFVDSVLADPRSWPANGGPGLGRTDGAVPANGFHIIFASPDKVDFLCHPLDTDGYFSCRNGQNVVLNADRWLNAVDDWETSLTEYRQYLINHEVGHALGFGHVECPGPGQLAPVMMQQTITIGECAPNSWPFPEPA